MREVIPGRARLRPLPLLAAMGTGAALTVESVINGSLGNGVGAVPAAGFSNLLSLTVMLCVAPFLPGLRPAFRRVLQALRERRLRPWHLMGGVAGGSMVLTQAAVAADLGPALYAMALISGQTLAGLLVDHFGVGPGGARPTSRYRAVGAALTVVAVVIPVLLEPGSHGALWLAAAPFAAGAGLSLQLAANGRTDEVANNAYPSVVLSFFAGVVILLAALTVDVAISGLPQDWPANPLQYTGGFLGVVVVLGSVLVVRRIGVLAAGLGMVGGQVMSSLLLGGVMETGTNQGWATMIGAVLLLVAVFLASPGGPDRTGSTYTPERSQPDPTVPAVRAPLDDAVEQPPVTPDRAPSPS